MAEPPATQPVRPDWVERAWADNVPFGAALLAARNWGVAAGRRHDLAADATSEAYAKTYRDGQGIARLYVDEVHYRRTLVVVARNSLVDLLRKERRRRPLSDAAEAPVPAPSPLAGVERCLAELPAADAELIRRTYDLGHTLDQLAAELPPDERTANARRLAVRKRRLAIEGRLAECLQREEVDDA